MTADPGAWHLNILAAGIAAVYPGSVVKNKVSE